MNIALDWDGTYTEDPELWNAFIANAKERGHKVYIVTCRNGTMDNALEVDAPGCLTYFTNYAPKEWFMRDCVGIDIDVWIDNEVKPILYGR